MEGFLIAVLIMLGAIGFVLLGIVTVLERIAKALERLAGSRPTYTPLDTNAAMEIRALRLWLVRIGEGLGTKLDEAKPTGKTSADGRPLLTLISVAGRSARRGRPERLSPSACRRCSTRPRTSARASRRPAAAPGTPR